MIGGLIRAALRTRGYEVVRSPNLGDFLRSRDCDLVVDVGANVGQFGVGLRKLWNGPILSVEPVSTAYSGLRQRAARDRKWETRQVALGEEPGEAEINVSENSVFSSMLAISEYGRSFSSAGITVSHTETVPVETLDGLLCSHPSQHPFIKLDVQGFERSVLAGGPQTLERAVGLQLELPVEHLYEGVWSFSEGICWLEARGFVPAQIGWVNSCPGDYPAAVELDCVFRRTTPALPAASRR